MKKVFAILVLLVLSACYAIPVLATDGTTTGNYFDDKILPYITAGGTGVVGSLAGFIGMVRSNKKKVDEELAKINAASAKLDEKTKKLEELDTKVSAKLASIEGGVKSFTENANSSMLRMTEEVKAQKDTIQAFGGQITSIADNQTRATKAILIGFGNDAELVKNGYAKEICALMKQGETIVQAENTVNP